MWPTLTNISFDHLGLGLEQAAAAIVLCAAVILVCFWHGVDARREAFWSNIRGLIQMLAVGLFLAMFLNASMLLGAGVLAAMLVAASQTASKRGNGSRRDFTICLAAIATGSGLVLIVMMITGALSSQIAVLVPVGSMIIANAMNACAQAIERLRADCKSHIGEIESALALGATTEVAARPYVNSAVYASLLPRLDMLKSLGLVWIPGVMAGMMVGGASPVYAALFQFVIVAMILAASGATGLVASILTRKALFSPADQLRRSALADRP
jgi:putative ABC transport system permease protein